MKGELNIHIQRVHEKLVVAKCPYCDREFTYKKVLKMHIEAKHTEGTNWQCDTVGESHSDSQNAINFSLKYFFLSIVFSLSNVSFY